jgi:hypothetical protein
MPYFTPYAPYAIHETYSSLHAVEFKQVDAVSYTLDVTGI